MRRFAATATSLLAALAPLLLAALAPAADVPPGGEADNPCQGPEARLLLCPDLRVGPAFGLYVERGGPYGPGELLRAGNDIRSRGRGPVELRGQRIAPRWMRANQAIYRVDGGVRVFRTEARLRFVDVGRRYGGSYWKAFHPLSMEIWALGADRRPLRRVRVGPKVTYCFRDLERTKAMPRSPRRRVYPACSQDPGRERVRLGTSVGWSDIYPPTYDRQWVDVTGLRGCHAFVMRVDPENLLYEENERNNRSIRIVRLPFRPGPQRC